jgi:hypothetical protein
MYLYFINCIDHIESNSRITANEDLKNMRNKPVVLYVKAFSQYLLGSTEENHEEPPQLE